MKLFSEFLFLAVFLIVFKVYGIYPAIASAIALYGAQLMFTLIKNKRVDKMQLVTFLVVLVLGGASLLFQNELFFKWKPSIIYWALGLGIVGAQLIRKKPSLEMVLSQTLQLPSAVWYRLDYVWAAFFGFLGGLNLLIAYQYSTSVWVYFKIFGTIAAFIVFIVFQMVWLSRYAKSH